jgi:hypothetical protein
LAELTEKRKGAEASRLAANDVVAAMEAEIRALQATHYSVNEALAQTAKTLQSLRQKVADSVITVLSSKKPRANSPAFESEEPILLHNKLKNRVAVLQIALEAVSERYAPLKIRRLETLREQARAVLASTRCAANYETLEWAIGAAKVLNSPGISIDLEAGSIPGVYAAEETRLLVAIDEYTQQIEREKNNNFVSAPGAIN